MIDVGKLWIDDDSLIKKSLEENSVPDSIKDNFIEFCTKGYTIFKGAVSPSLIDEIIKDTHDFKEEPENYILKRQGKYIDPETHGDLERSDRIVDLYAVSDAARQAIAQSKITEFLTFIFGEPPIAMQSISFEYGSQQAIHQDTAYVISEKPLNLAASWLALEDIVPGSGELIYYPGSHKFDHFFFSGEYKGWSKGRDGVEQHKDFLANLHTQAQQRGIEKESFIAEKGDILIWHADLAHGGEKITTENQTRRSLVTHYCPQSVKATYKKHIPEQYYEYNLDGMNFTSRHYGLKSLEKNNKAPIIYDAGITKARQSKKS